MSKTYKGSLTLEWYNKQKSILLADEQQLNGSEIPAPRINWVNKDEALFYEVVEDEGRGLRPYWVDRNDIRVKEARPLIHQKTYKAIAKDKPGTLAGMDTYFEVEESTHDDPTVENILIKGDNLLALNTLKKTFDNKPDDEKVKCIYIDPPYNTGSAFENYDDSSLKHSEWLTLMRDRLVILRELLQESGTICVSIDNHESSYLQILMDDVFGKDNRKNIVTLKRGSVTGAKVINPGLVNVSEFILVYAKNSEYWKPNRIYKSKDRDERYGTFIENFEEPFQQWKYVSLLDAFAFHKSVSKKNLKVTFGDKLESEIEEFVYANANRVMQFATLDENSISMAAKKLKNKSIEDDKQTYILERENKNPYYIYKGKLILFVKDRLLNIDGKVTFSEPVTDIWDDVLPNDLHNEGGVDFRKGKKPEKLIQRIIDFCTSEKDIVLDCFGGSGSTFATAHKMNRRWIGIEIGNHAETHIIKRLKEVFSGNDFAGITKSQNWQGGGSFKYYHLGPSIIATAEDGMGDFNWALGAEFIQESLLSSYDYTEVTNLQLPEQLYALPPKIGVQKVGNHTRVGIISLNPPKGDAPMMSYDEIKALYDTIKAALNPNYINMFTNRGIEIAADSKPDDLEIIKVPHAIFAELEK